MESIFFLLQIRRFVKSYKKFAAPLQRLEAIACDAELQEKPLAELKNLAEMLRDRCRVAISELPSNKENGESNAAPATEDRYSFNYAL